MTPAEAYRVYWAATYQLTSYETAMDWECKHGNCAGYSVRYAHWHTLARLARIYQTRALNAWCRSPEAYR
jgi:hypothetical protein